MLNLSQHSDVSSNAATGDVTENWWLEGQSFMKCNAAQRPLVEHLNDYEADLLTRGRAGCGGRGARLLKARIIRLMDECRWKSSGHVTADSFVMWRYGHKAAVRTNNHYLQGMLSFLNWLEKGDRIKFNPLKNVGKIDERGQKKRVRRAFTDDELRKLIKGSGQCREMPGCGSFMSSRSAILRDPTPQGNLREIKHSWKNPG